MGEIFTGIISRAHLLAVLQDAAGQDGAAGGNSSSSRPGGMVNGSSSNGTGDASVGRRQSLLPRQLSWPDLNRKMMDPVEAGRGGSEQQMVEVRGTPSCDLDMLTGPLLDEEIDLGPYINTSAVAVSRGSMGQWEAALCGVTGPEGCSIARDTACQLVRVPTGLFSTGVCTMLVPHVAMIRGCLRNCRIQQADRLLLPVGATLE